LNPTTRSSSQDDQVTALIGKVYEQSDQFPPGSKQLQAEYRERHLRAHIDAVMQLNSKVKNSIHRA